MLKIQIYTLCAAADLPALAGRFVSWDARRSRDGDLWACCPFHNEATPSFHVYRSRGRWRWWCFGACGAGGDALDFLERTGLSRAAAIEALGGADFQATPQRIAAQAADDDAQRRRRIEKALAIWRAAQPVNGGAAEAYLRRTRGIRGDIPEDIRAGAVWFAPLGREVPSVVSAIRNAGGEAVAAHSIALTPDGQKAASDPRRCWGAARGGAIRLDAPRDTVFIAEGVEDALALRWALGSDRVAVWAAPSASFLAGVDLPEIVQRVVICADNDAAGREAAERLKARLIGEGRRVRLNLPPTEGSDWSDILTSGAEVAA